MKKLLLVDSDKESSFVLSKQLEFDKKYAVHQAIGYQELQELKEEKKITDIILINIHKRQHDSVVLAQISDSFPNSQLDKQEAHVPRIMKRAASRWYPAFCAAYSLPRGASKP